MTSKPHYVVLARGEMRVTELEVGAWRFDQIRDLCDLINDVVSSHSNVHIIAIKAGIATKLQREFCLPWRRRVGEMRPRFLSIQERYEYERDYEDWKRERMGYDLADVATTAIIQELILADAVLPTMRWDWKHPGSQHPSYRMRRKNLDAWQAAKLLELADD